MAFPTKGSSRIVVDGVTYRWRIRRKPTYMQGAFDSEMTVSVQTADNPKCVLLVRTGFPRPDNWLTAPSTNITPQYVERSIHKALSDGWKPNEKGKAFELDGSEIQTLQSGSE